MSHTAFLRIKKLTGKSVLLIAAKHNLREIAAERGALQGHIDHTRIASNVILRGSSTAAGVAQAAQVLMDQAGVRSLRKDAVRGLEIIFSLAPDTTIELARFFDDAVGWIEQRFQAPILSALVHLDEAAPHCHVLILPLVNGHMVGSALMGNRAKLQALQADFHSQVGQGYGLMRQEPEKRLSASIRRHAIANAHKALSTLYGLSNQLIKVLIEPHFSHPQPLIEALGLVIQPPTEQEESKSSKLRLAGKSNPIGFDETKPIGFKATGKLTERRSLSCVGIACPTGPDRELHEDLSHDGDYVRLREDENEARQWNESLGQFEPLEPKGFKQKSLPPRSSLRP